MAGAAVGGGVGQAHALDAAGIVGGEFLALHAHRQFRTAVFLAQALAAQAELLAEAFAGRGHFDHLRQRLGGTEGRVQADLRLAEIPSRDIFHGGTDRGAEGMGSMPCSLHSMLAYCRASRSPTPLAAPSAQAASYSGRRMHPSTSGCS